MCDGFDWIVCVRCVEFGGFVDENIGDEIKDDVVKVFVILFVVVEEDFNVGNGEDNYEDRGGVYIMVEGVEEVGLGSVIFCGDGLEVDGCGEDVEVGDLER